MLIYLLVRLFTRKREFIEGDELRHMATAKNFYKLWNRSFYDTHPPLYSWFMKKFAGLDFFLWRRFIGYYRAGVMVSLLSSIGLYLICLRLYEALGMTEPQRTIAITCLTFNYTLIYYSNKAFRYQLIALLGTAMIYLGVIHSYLLMGVCWGLLSLTCSFMGLRAFWIWLAFPNIVSLVPFIALYGSWIKKKLNIYNTHDYYPSGIDGKIEPVYDPTIKQLISPLYFSWNYAYYGKRELGYDFKNWHKKIGGVFGLYKPLGFLVPIALFFMIRGMLSSPWQLTGLTLILLYPSLLKRFLPRNSIIAIPLICYFIGKGFPYVLPQWVYFALWGVLPVFLWFHREICLREPKIKANVISRFLNHLPKDGILVEGLIAYPIAYRSHKRVVVLPHEPDPAIAKFQTDLSIDKLDLNYAVFSDLWKTEEHLGYPAIDYIKTFNLIKTIKEDNDTYYIYDLLHL